MALGNSINFGDDLKKIFLAGVGAIATSTEKSKEVIDQLVSKGELTVAQGKVLNEELKRKVNDTLEQNKEKEVVDAKIDYDAMVENLGSLTDEELAALKEKLNNI